MSAAPKGIRVLLVEDDEDSREAIAIYLRHLGFEVVEALDGAQALVALQVEPGPHVVLLDLLMPVLDGFEVLRRYQGQVPIIVMSAWTDHRDLPRQPYAAVLKPGSMREITALLEKAATEGGVHR